MPCKRVLLLTVILSFLPTAAGGQGQQAKIEGAATPGGIVLVWSLPPAHKYSELLLYRKRPDRARRRLITETPIRRTKDKDELKRLLGPGVLKQMRSTDASIRLSEEEILENILADNQYVELAALYYPRLGEVLGLRYFDRLVVKSKTYTYWLVARVDGREVTLGRARVNSSAYPSIKKPLGLKGKFENGRADLEWQPLSSLEVIGYHVYRNEHEDGDFKRLTQVPLAYLRPEKKKVPVVYTDHSVKPGKTYWYQVTAVHYSHLESDRSQTLKLKDATRPLAPVMTKASLQRDGRIIIQWAGAKEKSIAYYDIYRADSRTGKFKKINGHPLAPNLGSYTDRLQKNGGFYWYRVKAVNKENTESEFSAAISCRLKRLVKASAIGAIKAIRSANSISLSWPGVKEKEIKHYIVERAEKLKGRFYEQARQKKNFYRDKKIKPGRTYYYRLSWVDHEGNQSKFSETITVQSVDTRPAVLPALFRATARQNQVRLSWQAIHTEQLKGYRLQVKTNADSRFRRIKDLAATRQTFHYQLHPATTEAVFRIYTLSHSGITSEEFRETSVRMKKAPLPPVKVTLVQKTSNGGQVMVAIYWQKNPHPDLAGYHIFRKEVEGSVFNRVNAKIIDSNQQLYFDTGADTGGRYVYYLVGIDKQGRAGRKSRMIIYEGN